MIHVKPQSVQLGFPYINLNENPPDPTAVVLIPKDVALKRVCVAKAGEAVASDATTAAAPMAQRRNDGPGMRRVCGRKERPRLTRFG